MNILHAINDELEAILDDENANCSDTTGNMICEVQTKIYEYQQLSIQQRIDDLLNAEYEALKAQALAICEDRELDASCLDLNDSVEMEFVDEQESRYADNFDFEMDMARTYEDSWLWQEMSYGQKLGILQEIKETIQSLLNPTT